MRILQVTPLYYPSLGGVERHVQAICEGLIKLGHEVVVWTLTHDRRLPQHELIRGVEVWRFPSIGPRDYRIPLGLFLYLHRHGPSFDVVHAHNYGGLPLLLAVLTCRKHTVITPHYHGHGNSRVAEILHRLYDPFATLALRGVSRVVCDSSGESQLVELKFGIAREHISIIPSIIDIADEMVVTPRHHAPRIDSATTFILSVGRLVAYKRVDRIIASLPYLPDNLTLNVVGTGPKQAALKQLAEQLGVRSRVKFFGSVSDQELHDLYCQAHVVVSLSEGEAFGRIVVEALARSCQAVCSDIPAFRDLAVQFPQAVSLVSPEMDSVAVASIIQSAASNPLREPVDLRRFAWLQVTTELIGIYRDIAARNSS